MTETETKVETSDQNYQTCEVCGQQARRGGTDPSDWIKLGTEFWDLDGEGRFLNGEALREAEETSGGFVCSLRCKRQVMYNMQSPEGQRDLDRVLDACRVLTEAGPRVQAIINTFLDDWIEDSLVGEAKYLRKAVGDVSKDFPAWTERGRREEELESALEKAGQKFRRLAGYLGSRAQMNLVYSNSISFNDEVEAKFCAKKAWRAAEAAQEIAAVLKEVE